MSLKGKIKDIADSLRETLGTNVKYTLSQMPPLIRSLNFKYKTDDIYYNFLNSIVQNTVMLLFSTLT